MPTLAVGIPTYNRPEALCRRIKEVDKFSEDINELVICDNTRNIDPNLLECINAVSVNCHYSKNKGNIGGGANFVRVVEKATTDYMWWRGDDDVISQNQVSAVVNNLAITPRLILLSPNEKTVFSATGIDAFVDHFDKIRTMGWLSSIVLPVEIAQQALAWGYFGVASGWANVALVLGMFRVCPNLAFVVVPITMQVGEFRELGQESLDWALFNTCIKKFPLTALVLPSQALQRRYIANWRATHHYSWMRTMIRFKLGYLRKEKITFSTFQPFMSISNPKISLLALLLCAMLIVPACVYQSFFSVYWLFLSEEKKGLLGLNFLLPYKNFHSVYKALRDHQIKDTAKNFL